MNKRQKLVQEQFLDDEEKVIKRLKQVYGQSLKDINGKVAKLDSSIGQLQKALADVGDDDIGDLARSVLGSKKQFTPEEAKETLKSMIQSKVYQKNYQTALKKQVGDILDTMQDKEFKVVSDYLTECYENGFIGAMYDLHGQGIPMCFPLDQEAMVRAVQLDSKISQGLYSRLGEDVALLKKKITAQVSRGISTGMSYQQVAQQLAKDTNIGYNNAVRIARTEGGRIRNQSAYDAAWKAKEAGADIVLQWDAALDKRTRESHAKVDGEIVELGETFSNGLLFPCDPRGSAAEVVNCRCAALQRARWALDDGELDTLKERAAYFGLDKTENFEDFKKKYLKAAESTVGSENARGFAAKISGDGIPEHDSPILLQTIDYTDKKAVLEILTNFEKNAIMEPIETACVITRNGKVYKCFGTENRVFPDFDLKDELIGATMSHNHPIAETYYTFSGDDLGGFQKYALDLLRGCDEKYTYELTRDAKLIDDDPEDWDNFENYYHAIMIMKAKENGVGYRRWLNE